MFFSFSLISIIHIHIHTHTFKYTHTYAHKHTYLYKDMIVYSILFLTAGGGQWSKQQLFLHQVLETSFLPDRTVAKGYTACVKSTQKRIDGTCMIMPKIKQCVVAEQPPKVPWLGFSLCHGWPAAPPFLRTGLPG